MEFVLSNGATINDDPVGIAPHEFLKVMFQNVPTGYVEVCYLAPEGMRLYPHEYVQWAALPLGELDPALPNIHKQNAKGYSCYFAPAVRAVKYEAEQRISKKSGKPYTMYPRGKAKDALYITSLWIDIDEPGESGYRRAMEALTPMASIIISSGGGYHAYWLLNKPLLITDDNRAMVKQTLKGMALACGSDTKVADLARIMRLPGTINTKPGRGARCEAIDFIPVRYDYMDFELAYSPLAAPPIPQPTRYIPASARETTIPKWIQTYLETGERQGNRNQRAYSAARGLLDAGFSLSDVETLIGNRARADGLDDVEIDTLINSAYHAPRETVLPSYMQTRMGVADKRLKGRS